MTATTMPEARPTAGTGPSPQDAPYSAAMEAELCTMLFRVTCHGMELRRVDALDAGPSA